ncbi:hypothetical protein [Spirillospora sp. CA-294931]|uniref:hypothetical protein n=1 Tax=Spirillospora sp. CA-294931 TaxID=3240042 RepID=UPI003D8BEB36
MLRFVAIVLVLPMLASCGVGAAKKEPRPRVSASAMDPHRLMGAMVASYPGLKQTYSDAQDHMHQLNQRLVGDKPQLSGCLGRLSPVGHLKALGAGAAQAPAALRMWGRGYYDVRILQTVVALPGGGAKSAVEARPFPENCRAFRSGGVRFTVNEYPVDLGDGGYVQVSEATGRKGTATRESLVRFSYRGVYVLISGLADRHRQEFPQLALRKLREASL